MIVEFKTLNYEDVTIGEEFFSDDFLIKPEEGLQATEHGMTYCPCC